jgi:hypothetical protein
MHGADRNVITGRLRSIVEHVEGESGILNGRTRTRKFCYSSDKDSEFARFYTFLQTREALACDDDARALLRRLFVTPANLRPDPLSQTLTVELHRLGSPLQDLAVAHLCKLLTDSETLFPTTNLCLIFRQVGST